MTIIAGVIIFFTLGVAAFMTIFGLVTDQSDIWSVSWGFLTMAAGAVLEHLFGIVKRLVLAAKKALRR